jgi:DNA-binding LacI/PurR family transcriptional regulator
VAEVLLDNAEAMRQTTGHLIAHGHKRILHVSQNHERSDFLHRRQGYEEAMLKAGLEPLVFDGDGIWEDERDKALIETIGKYGITALACSNDATAVEAWDLAEANGIRVPDEVSITGMDDLPEHLNRGLTTIRFSCEAVGRSAVEAILRMGQGESAESCSKAVPVELIVRQSVQPRRS